MTDTANAKPRPATLHPGWILLGGLFVTPLLGAAFSAYNHARYRSWVGAFAAIALAVAGGLLSGTAIAALGPQVGYGVALALHFATVGGLFWEQILFRRAHLPERHVRWVWPVFVGFLVWLVVRAFPAVVWIITGDPALRPFAGA